MLQQCQVNSTAPTFPAVPPQGVSRILWSTTDAQTHSHLRSSAALSKEKRCHIPSDNATGNVAEIHTMEPLISVAEAEHMTDPPHAIRFMTGRGEVARSVSEMSMQRACEVIFSENDQEREAMIDAVVGTVPPVSLHLTHSTSGPERLVVPYQNMTLVISDVQGEPAIAWDAPPGTLPTHKEE
ncbi:hypothetical protein Pelo_9918 [Pelomyxa schiedti]|nr:hypothetical protein Pelo_9918 [Pelomyxa schiedti]